MNCARLFLLFLLTLATINLKAEKISYALKGETTLPLNGKQVMLFKFHGEEVSEVDTSTITDGKFFFEAKGDSTRFAILSCGNYPDTVYAARLMLEEGVISVKLASHSIIGGTPLNDIYQTYLEEYRSVNDSLTYEYNRTVVDSIDQRNRDKKASELYKKLDRLKYDFIAENCTNRLGISLFKEKYTSLQEYDLNRIYAKTDDQLRRDPEVMRYLLWKKREKAKDKKREEDLNKLNGQPYIDFTFKTPDGKQKKISDYIGKSNYLLLDFWASWCGPCMREQPLIKEVYAKYKDKGFEVISISFDSNDKQWKNAIQKIQPNWPQLCDLDGGRSGIKEAYEFRGIPHLVLINQEGKIVLCNLPGEYLEQILSQFLKE